MEGRAGGGAAGIRGAAPGVLGDGLARLDAGAAASRPCYAARATAAARARWPTCSAVGWRGRTRARRPGGLATLLGQRQIGRASCRERVSIRV